MKPSALLAAFVLLLAASNVRAETAAEKDARMQWFNEARFGMFIHWGAYSVAAGEWDGKPVAGAGEWIQCTGRIPADEYRNTLQGQFNPIKYDAEAWVLAAKNAGMKYIVITSKHHDGFCLWDSKLTDWDIGSTPYKKDLLKPLAEACRKHGMKFCLYHSIMDWHHPDYSEKASWRGNARKQKPDMDAYVTYLKGQLKELLTDYGDVGLLWFDGEWESAWTHERGIDLSNYVHTLQPKVIINNRIDKGRAGTDGKPVDPSFAGDYGTPEQEIPTNGFGPRVPWETCMTMNDTWGFKKSDLNWKSTETLVRNLIDISSKGGNYLLNVGPTAEGEIPSDSLARLSEIGVWMKANGESIQGTTATSFPKYSWNGRSTTRRNADGTTRLYLHVFRMPENREIIVRGLENKPIGATVLGLKSTITISGHPGDWILQFPMDQSSSPATVATFTIQGEPVIRDVAILPDAAGTVTLDVPSATLHGNKLQIEEWGGKANIGYWMDPADFVSWNVKVPSGRYQVKIDGSCASTGSEFKLQLGTTESSLSFPGTGSFQSYQIVSGPVLDIPEEVSGNLSIKAVSGTGVGFVNIRAVTLERVR